MVVPCGIDGQRTNELAVLVQDPDIGSGCQNDDPDPGELASKADVVEPALVAEGDRAALVDLVPPHPVAVDVDTRSPLGPVLTVLRLFTSTHVVYASGPGELTMS